jgi:regulator of sigma E protease
MNILNLLEVILAFGFMIFIHEGGHYLACRLFGVEVEEFALGFGQILVSRQWGKTLYSIRAFPLGGFCKPKGGDLSGQTAEEMYAKPAQPGEFLFAAWWRRVVIFFAGPIMNFLSALVIVTATLLMVGEPFSDKKPILGFVPPGSVAEKAGLKSGDVILAVDGKDTVTFQAVEEGLPTWGKSAVLKVQRGAQTLEKKFEVPAKPADTDISKVDLGISDNTPAIVGEAHMGQPARNAGVQDGDTILSINGQKPADWAQLAYFIRHATQDPIQLVIQRDAKTYPISIKRIYTGEYMAIGIGPKMDETQYKKIGVVDAVKDGVGFTLNQTSAIVKGLGNLVTAKVSLKDSVAGPITIMRMMYHRATQKIEDFLALVSSISLMLFLMNLLPIPVVDGGQIVLCLIEGIKRNPVSVRLQMYYQNVGFVVIIALMGLAVFNDLKNIFLELHNHLK